jgi:HEAT repeat protein
VRQQAVLSLGKREDVETAPDLLPLLDDPDPTMRFVTPRALGQIRSPEAVPRIIPFLRDSRKELRFAAVEALGAMRATAAARPLVTILGDPDRNLRRASAESLGAVGDPQAVPPLTLALEDEHWSVRCAAAAALGRIRSPKATPALLARLADDATVRRRGGALGEVGDPGREAPRAGYVAEPGLQVTALEALRSHGPGRASRGRKGLPGSTPEEATPRGSRRNSEDRASGGSSGCSPTEPEVRAGGRPRRPATVASWEALLP